MQQEPPPNHTPDAELIERCSRDDASAWEALVDRYARLVYSIPSRANLPPEACDDVFQTVWTICVRSLGQIRDGAALPAWLITTAQRETWRVSRRLRREGEIPANAGLETWADPADAAQLEEMQQLRMAMEGLDERCRDLLREVFSPSSGSYDQIAARLGIPRGSVGPTRARCIDRLKILIARVDRPITSQET